MGILDNDTIKQLVADLEKRVSEHILEPNNLEFLKKLLSKAESEDEAISICKLGTTFYKTGLVFDKKMEVPSDGIKIFKKNNELSFGELLASPRFTQANFFPFNFSCITSNQTSFA